MGRVLILTDGKAGHENQSKALARQLGCAFDVVGVRFRSKFHKALSYLFDRLGIRTLRLFEGGAASSPFVRRTDAASPFCAVLGTGSGTFYAVKAFAKELGVKCGVVLYPRGYVIASFDCILAPSFDRPKKAPNVIEIPANLVANDVAFYERGVEAFGEHYAKTTGRALADAPDAVAVIVGGPNKCSTMTVDWMKRELDKIFSALHPQTSDLRPQASDTLLWVTTSRRTPPEVEALVDGYPWDYKLIYSRDRFNPIPAFVSLAKKLYVTAESTGMLSEACTFGTSEVVPLDNLKPGPHKFRRFMEGLVGAGCARGVKLDLSAQFAAARNLMGL